MSRRSALRVAAAVTALAAATGCSDFSVYELPLPGGTDTGDNAYTVQVEFTDVIDLVPQSSVKMDDVNVGTVTAIDLDGWTAVATLELRGDVELPANAEARMRQTSLLGEKFVSLSEPTQAQPSGRLSEGDVIPLARSGRVPEVEEVFGALSLLLNGGGLRNIKTITQELNVALEGREPEVRALLGNLDTFVGRLDDGKDDIVLALERVNNLSIEVNQSKREIIGALDTLPATLTSLDGQREDLVAMLEALADLSDVGTEVIAATKEGTLTNLQNLQPILARLADSGDNLPAALDVGLTYPFPNAMIGTTPTEARNLHIGDFTNLDAQLDFDLEVLLGNLPEDTDDLTDTICAVLPADAPPELVDGCEELGGELPELPEVPELPELPGLPGGPGDGDGNGGGLPDVPDLPELPELPGGGAGGSGGGAGAIDASSFDSDVAMLLLPRTVRVR